MKSKALLLAAHPPFEGPWVSISEAEAWDVTMLARGGEVNGGVHIEYVNRGGVLTRLSPGERLSGEEARVILDPGQDFETVSVVLEEAEV